MKARNAFLALLTFICLTLAVAAMADEILYSNGPIMERSAAGRSIWLPAAPSATRSITWGVLGRRSHSVTPSS